jgi:hypothetical protein
LQEQVDKENVQARFDMLEQKLSYSIEGAAEEAEELGEILLNAKNELEKSNEDIHKLKSQKPGTQQLIRAYREKAKDSKVYEATCKGIYTPEMQSLALFLMEAGCSRDYVGEVIEHIFNIAGTSLKGTMSGHTVTQCIIEGGIAAQIQLGYLDKVLIYNFYSSSCMKTKRHLWGVEWAIPLHGRLRVQFRVLNSDISLKFLYILTL